MTSKNKKIILSGFTMAAVSHINYGLWRHPQEQSHRYTDIQYWIELAQLLEKGHFDCLFIADALGLLDTYNGNADASLSKGIQSPLIDPLLLVSAMATTTQRLGFGITVSTTYEFPYLLARKFTTLDHLTRGRVAWNIVTSQLESAARNLGLEQQINHDERYERAEEFLDVAYQLWQSSWEEGAVVRDKAAGIYTDPQKVHGIAHKGRYFSVPDAHLSEPSPQRTPVLFQAGGSPRGIEFAARNAEVVFVAGMDAAGVRKQVAAIKAQAALEGRHPDSIKFISAITVITDATPELAQAKLEEYRQWHDLDGAVVHYSASTGVDLGGQDLDQTVEYRETNSNRSLLKMLDSGGGGKRWTLREAFSPKEGLGRQKTFVGDGAQVADLLEQWLEDTDTDGINLAQLVSPASFADFIEFVVPELIARGRINTAPRETLRQGIFPQGNARLPEDHPGFVKVK